MATMNKVQLIGYVGEQPEVRVLESGITVTTFSLATNTRWKTKDGEKKERTDWHRIVCYRGLAETIGKYVKKGAQLYIEGAINYRSYEKDEETHYITEIIASEFQFLDKKAEEVEAVAKAAPKKKSKAAAAKENAIDPLDIPF